MATLEWRGGGRGGGPSRGGGSSSGARRSSGPAASTSKGLANDDVVMSDGGGSGADRRGGKRSRGGRVSAHDAAPYCRPRSRALERLRWSWAEELINPTDERTLQCILTTRAQRVESGGRAGEQSATRSFRLARPLVRILVARSQQQHRQQTGSQDERARDPRRVHGLAMATAIRSARSLGPSAAVRSMWLDGSTEDA